MGLNIKYYSGNWFTYWSAKSDDWNPWSYAFADFGRSFRRSTHPYLY